MENTEINTAILDMSFKKNTSLKNYLINMEHINDDMLNIYAKGYTDSIMSSIFLLKLTNATMESSYIDDILNLSDDLKIKEIYDKSCGEFEKSNVLLVYINGYLKGTEETKKYYQGGGNNEK